MINREIKFRAFDDGKMLTMPLDTNFGISRFFGILRCDAIVMQFTGLTDKNGLEIYEWDVVKLDIEKEHDYKGYGIYVVVYKAPQFQIKYIEYSESLKRLFGAGKIFNNEYRDIWITDIPKIEVIGNIYENPELINSNQKS